MKQNQNPKKHKVHTQHKRATKVQVTKKEQNITDILTTRQDYKYTKQAKAINRGKGDNKTGSKIKI